MADKQEEIKKQNVQAEDNGIAIGSIDIGGDVSGSITIGGYSAEEVSDLLEQITSTFQPKPFDGRCPYKGLDVFEEEDAELFFGREKIVDDLVERVKESRTVFITGPSGSGKSSLVRAGLIPALKRGAIKNSERWLYETVKPGRAPLESLALAFSRLKSPELGKYFRENVQQSNVLHECAESALSGQKDQRLVLFFDQFEEVFTQVSQEESRATFLKLLTHAATVEDGRVVILFAMRSDFVSNCATYPKLNALLNQQFVQIGAMGPDELVSAIAQPALQVGLRIDPDLIAQIINDMQGEPGALPLMQFALKDLFEAEQVNGGMIVLTREAYLGRGGIQKSLERHADASFAKLEVHEQELARSIFGGLIEIGRGTQDTRRTALFDELIPASASTEEIETIVRKLADARLITTDELAGKDLVTISHEKLIDAWPWLKKLVNENRDVIALQNQVATDAKEWEDRNRDKSYLYTGARLANAREQLDAKKLALSGLAHEFVEASRARQQRGRVALVGSVSTVIVLLIAAVIMFARLTNEAQKQTTNAQAANTLAVAQKLTAEANASEAQRQANIANSQVLLLTSADSREIWENLLLSIESLDLVKNYPFLDRNLAERKMRDLLTQVGGIPLAGHEDEINTLAFSPDGEWLATGSNDNTARLWNIRNPSAAPIVLKGHEDDILTLTFNPDSEWLATGSKDTTTRLWNVRDPSAEPIVLRGHEDPVGTLVFSPDGRWLITRSVVQTYYEGTARLWNLSDSTAESIDLGSRYTFVFSPDSEWLVTVAGSAGSTISRLWKLSDLSAAPIVLMENENNIRSVTFSPDGEWLATGGGDNAARLWNLSNPYAEPIILKGHEATINSLAFSPDGKWLATRSDDRTARLWSISDPFADPIVLRGHEDSINTLMFSPDGEWLVTGSADKTVRLWNTSDPSADPIILKGHEASVDTLAFSPDGKWLVTKSSDYIVRLWSLQSPSSNNTIVLVGHETDISTLAFSLDGEWLAVRSRQVDSFTFRIRLWNLSDSSFRSIDLPPSYNYLSFAFSPDSAWIATAGNEGKVARLWNLRTLFSQPVILSGHEYGIQTSAFSPDGEWLATGSYDNTARLWNVRNPSTAPIVLKGHEDGIRTLAFSLDGQWLATGSDDGTARLWNVRNPLDDIIILEGHEDVIRTLAFSPDGEWLATGSFDKTARLWSLSNPFGDPIILRGHEDAIRILAFSPNGEWLATGSTDESARLWSLHDLSAKPIILGEDGYSSILAFSPDSEWLATRSVGNAVALWRMDNPTADPIILEGHEASITTLVFSLDGEWLVTGSYDNTVRIWSLHNLSSDPIVLRDGYPQAISALAISPDGEWLAAGGGCDFCNGPGSESQEYAVRLWNMRDLSFDPIVLTENSNDIFTLTFSPDGEWLAAGGRNNNVYLWMMNPNFLLETACEIVGRNFSFAKWNQYFPNKEYRKTCDQWSKDMGYYRQIAEETLKDSTGPQRIQTTLDEVKSEMEMDTAIQDPEFYSTNLVAEVVASEISNETNSGNWQVALDMLGQLNALADAPTLNLICWLGSLKGIAAQVLEYCERAVMSEPDNAGLRDSRGVARALTGDYAGAIEDFQYFVKNADRPESVIQKRKNWIDDLENDVNPFIDELLKELLEE